MCSVKQNAAGGLVWAKSAGGTGNDYPGKISTDPSGNVYVPGYFYSGVMYFGSDSLMNNGGLDMYIAKYTAAGNLSWVRGAGDAGNEIDRSVTLDGLQNVYIAGDFSSASITIGSTPLPNNRSTNILLIKYIIFKFHSIP